MIFFISNVFINISCHPIESQKVWSSSVDDGVCNRSDSRFGTCIWDILVFFAGFQCAANEQVIECCSLVSFRSACLWISLYGSSLNSSLLWLVIVSFNTHNITKVFQLCRKSHTGVYSSQRLIDWFICIYGCESENTWSQDVKTQWLCCSSVSDVFTS